MAYLNKLEMKQYLKSALDCVEFKLSKCVCAKVRDFLLLLLHVIQYDEQYFSSLPVRDRSDIDDDVVPSFQPEFAHQIFGENECIFGYKDLKIRLYYTAGPLNIYMGIKYTSRIDDIQSDGLKGDDISGSVTKLLTTGCYYTNIDEFLTKLDKEGSFQPFGEKVCSWNIEDEDNEHRTIEIYECNILTPGFLAFHARLQTFLLWFVDAASYIDTSDQQWTFLVGYEQKAHSFHSKS